MEKVLFKIAKQWIAGDTVDDALIAAKSAYSLRRHAIINKLGEYHTSKKQIKVVLEEYQKIVNSFRKWKIRGAISIKPTQIGLSISQKECNRNFEKIIQKARNAHVFVWLDMESSEHTDETIEIYHTFFSKYERLGIALQANLKRTENDLNDLIGMGAKIRLVKGAYREKANIAFKTKKDVDNNFIKLMKILFKKGNEFAIASHDTKIIQKAQSLSKKYPRKFEFQFLKGIREEFKSDLVKKKFVVSEYIPYGVNWLPYSIRRIKERKRNILLLGSSLIQSHRV
ncbi:proline dehydrogenase family protein [Marine Group I thaumarchaeote]|uniref:proline dehydrogenase n=1 Tax=Marine Group I thaumarchaeote TaxID=2511932 RepID=A0A7K4MFP3_9ARCH|nr:proline dehydrogenase [Nitrosopumilus sp. PRT-SC01]NWJ28036.1 proline dehydrogenase family protein [Marine Group I thaumarchaeote]NWJ29694.1 proline dehydrogenase family protein [Marine Group I thaumarchaeote]NWK07363.1 proline dehydrogenase family protein [Marine Group I thaumarchaeote]